LAAGVVLVAAAAAAAAAAPGLADSAGAALAGAALAGIGSKEQFLKVELLNVERSAAADRGENGMGKRLLAVLGFVGLLVLAGLMVGCSYVSSRNQMVAKDEGVKAAWSEVDVQLERRADLIPNLVETVKGFTKEESTVFGDIANARAGMLNAQGPTAKIAANGQLDGALGRLLLLTENYPQLRSSEQFMRLQDELAGTENRIGVARKRYNDALKDYNIYIRQFPNSIWAGMSGFQVNNAFFEASQSARTVPGVKF
jgi:LemA protein